MWGLGQGTMKTEARTLDRIAEHAARLQAVRRQDLRDGDWVVITTKNSTYALCTLGEGLYSVSGGWFDRHGGPQTLTVNGCTWGGHAIRTDIVAAPGLCLEFGNQVLTTRIREVRVIRAGEHSSCN